MSEENPEFESEGEYSDEEGRASADRLLHEGRLWNHPPQALTDELEKEEHSAERPLTGYDAFSDKVFLAYDKPVLENMSPEGIDYRHPLGTRDVVLGFDSTTPGRLLSAEVHTPIWGRSKEFQQMLREIFGANVWDRTLGRVATRDQGMRETYTSIPTNQYLRISPDELEKLKKRWHEIHLGE